MTTTLVGFPSDPDAHRWFAWQRNGRGELYPVTFDEPPRGADRIEGTAREIPELLRGAPLAVIARWAHNAASEKIEEAK